MANIFTLVFSGFITALIVLGVVGVALYTYNNVVKATVEFSLLSARTSERLTVAGVYYNGTLYYAIRNSGQSTVEITEYGYTVDGTPRILGRSVVLKPGDYILGNTTSSLPPEIVYAATRLGNLFDGRVQVLANATNQTLVEYTAVRPFSGYANVSFSPVNPPVKNATYTIYYSYTPIAFAWLTAYLYDPSINESYYAGVVIPAIDLAGPSSQGSFNVSETRSDYEPLVRVSATLNVRTSQSEGVVFSMPFTVKTSGSENATVTVTGCFGVAWITAVPDILGAVSVYAPEPGGTVSWNDTNGEYSYTEKVHVFLAGAVVDSRTLAEYYIDLNKYPKILPLNAGKFSVVYAKCFTYTSTYGQVDLETRKDMNGNPYIILNNYPLAVARPWFSIGVNGTTATPPDNVLNPARFTPPLVDYSIDLNSYTLAVVVGSS